MSVESLLGRFGAVSAGGALAAGAAMDVLREGGNAIDAVIAGSAVQCVTEMPWCGVGGDAFALIRLPDGSTVSFNGSGIAPTGVLTALGEVESVPRFGAISASVPAIVDAWWSIHARFGTMPFATLLEPARRYAADGMPLDHRLSHALAKLPMLDGGQELLSLVDGMSLSVGSTFRQPHLASTLEAIASGRDEFYRGVIGKRIVDFVARRGGAISLDDMASHAGHWLSPLHTTYRDSIVHSNAPVSMGVLLLACLKVLERIFPSRLPDDDVLLTDTLVHIKHLAFGDVLPRLGDPAFVDSPDVLADDAVAELAARVVRRTAPGEELVAEAGSDTTSLAVTSADGTVVSFIHSLFNEFGARELVPETGIILNDRLANLRPGPAANALAPGKRPMHTLHCYLVDRADGSVFTGATPGGRGQVQTNLQVLIDVLDRHNDLQTAVSRPRWVNGMPRVAPNDTTLYLEPALAGQVGRLVDLGHEVEVVIAQHDDRFGNCTVVGRNASADRHLAAADERRSGHAQVW